MLYGFSGVRCQVTSNFHASRKFIMAVHFCTAREYFYFLKISLKMSWFQFLSCKAKCISIWLGKWRIFLLWVGMLLHSTQFCCCCSSFSCFFMAVYRCTSSHSRHDAQLLSEWVASAFRLVLFGSEENRRLCLFGIIPVTSDRTLWPK